MERQIRRVGIALMLAFLAVFAQLNYVQIFAARNIAGNRNNYRQLLLEYSIKRGEIITVDGKVLATSRATKDQLKYQRRYPGGELYGHLTGYYSILYGKTRIESSYDDQLLGRSGVVTIQDIGDRFLGSGEEGDDVKLTVHSRLQQVARDALGNNRGAVVALDPTTGEVRALWSSPSYNPDPLGSHEAEVQRRARRALRPASRTSPLIPLATSRSYFPGSTFKVVTAAAALENGYTPNSTFPDPEALQLPLTNETLQNFTRTSCVGGGQIDLFTALEISCDTTFGLLGLRLHDEIRAMSEALGFNEPLPFDVGTEASTFPRVPDDQEPTRAFAGIGQGDTSATPLQMAIVAATVANGGRVPRPRLVREVLDPRGGFRDSFAPETLGRAMSRRSSDQLTEMMVAVVDSGTGTAAQIPGLEVAGKTGTSQTGIEGQSPHAWFIAFAPAQNPKLAVAVIVENGGTFGSEATGGRVAAPIAKAMIEADRAIRGW